MARQRVVFVSCGQRTDEEIALGRALAAEIERHGMTAFFAQDVHSAGDLNSEVFKAIQTCDAFLGILQKRGVVKYADFPPVERSSVWIQQEIAIFCYRMFLERKSLPIRVYSEREIRREGVIEIAVVNPIEFDRGAEVIAGVNVWLASREFEEHPVLARREELFEARLARTSDLDRLLLELVAAHCPEPDDFAQDHSVRDDFYAIVRSTGIKDDAVEARFREAYARLNSLGFFRIEKDRSTGEIRIWIAKQWFQLVLDELRGRGGRV